ncbi:serine/threonine protein kinase [Trichormus variabilis ARAD]|nr:serine/threonine protein kinase [Trichormus variabilis ARAD]MBC1256702.1 serine/threonine protein kinase [Trichormus variabilis V5]MBC1267797.1 serine/threonine protein kinase [Trichormus variabilis FSR]MBC1303901.1 serine/threonine protein kinase [Trichormus variabilis N2B]MBC1314086.1 serine/threonine protein kinase [Trichormus variabilis PNB]MBC1329437.1 serine/threonine protein kinase [Trichormus variabilis 9RC]MBD2380582.1 serine/threonine protein kinase [Trichormus variabilis FACHB-3
MIGKILQARYQIVQNLGSGVFGQTYIAVDINYPHQPKCVVKQLKVNSFHSSQLDTIRLRFLTETETLKHLGQHPQIPNFIACFEENERFYLVQEYVAGHALTAELPIAQNWGSLWREDEVITFLEDALSILQFVHSQGVIHCDVKPENLIRRAVNGKLVLIDFGSIQSVNFGIDEQLSIYQVPATSLGYIPPEQFIGKTQINSDIYALGMIAIQALTGLEPLQLKIDPDSNEIIWRFADTPVSDYLAAILSQMIRYNFQERFQSAAEVLRVLQQMKWETSLPQLLQTQQIEYRQEPNSDQPSPLITGMKVGLAVNTLLMGLGTYSLLSTSPANTETEILYKATKEYQDGDLKRAIALAKLIPSHSNVYPDAQATIDEWQQQWQTAAKQYSLAEQALLESRWSDVFVAASEVPNISYWQSKVKDVVEKANVNIEAQTQNLLAKAYDKARAKDFSSALEYLRQIPQESSAGALVQQKLAEYNQKKQIRAAYFLHQARKQALAGNFNHAVNYLRKIPQGTPVYAQAQAKLNEYTQKLRPQIQKAKSLIAHNSVIQVGNVQSEIQLPEVNIR